MERQEIGESRIPRFTFLLQPRKDKISKNEESSNTLFYTMKKQGPGSRRLSTGAVMKQRREAGEELQRKV